MLFRLSLSLVLSFALAACDGDPSTVDGSTPVDASRAPRDGSPSPMDANPPNADGGPGPLDAGVGPDAGMRGDSGVSEDGGSDAGSTDAGSTDGGPSDTDASMPPPGATAGLIPIPAVNTNGGVYFTSLAALDAALTALDDDWAGTMSGWGLPTSGTEPVLGLAQGAYGNLGCTNHGPYAERVTIRGEGPYSRDDYTPTAGTRVGRLLWNGCQDMRLMGLVAEPTTLSGAQDASNHRMLDCRRVEWVRLGIYGDVARSAAALATTPSRGAFHLIRPDGSNDCSIVQSVLMGSMNAVLGGTPPLFGQRVIADDIEFRGNVMAQNHNDIIKVAHGQTNDWVVADNLTFGKGRNSSGQHRDFIQILATGSFSWRGEARDWRIEGNWIQSRTAWGLDTYLAKQGMFWGNGSLESRATIYDNMLGIPGKGVQVNHDGASVTFNSFFVPIDSLDSATSGGRFTANFTGFRSDAYSELDENIVFGFGTGAVYGAGPNGVGIASLGFVGHDSTSSTWDWSAMGAFLENYDDTYTTDFALEVSPREEGGVEQYAPRAGSRAHWDHPDPTGCFRLYERVFDEEDHDHWKDWGWPTAPAAHLYYDTTNAMGGASGAYNTFDANGR